MPLPQALPVKYILVLDTVLLIKMTGGSLTRLEIHGRLKLELFYRQEAPPLLQLFPIRSILELEHHQL